MTKPSLAERLYARLLRVLPFDFQRDYGADMATVFRDQHRAARRTGGSMARMSLWWRTVLGILSIAPREHAEAIRHDITVALRSFRTHPGMAAIAVLTLGLAIGATTAIFTVVHGVLLRPFPYPDAARILMLNEINERDGTNLSVAYPNFKDWAAQATTFEHLGIYRQSNVNLTGRDPAERVSAASVSAAVFRTMSVEPMLGRAFSADEDRAGASPVVVISERLWRRRFGADASIVGQSVLLNQVPHTVVGVMPDVMRFPSRLTDAWLPFGLIEAQLQTGRGAHPNLWVVGRLRAGVAFEQAAAELETIADRLSAAYPESNASNGIRVVPFREVVVQNIRPVLLLLFGAVGLVLLLACVNLANLLLARADARRHEMALRASLGAGRGRLVRQVLTESLVLSAAGSVLGLGVAYGAVRLLVRAAPSNIPRLDQILVDTTVLAFTAAVTIASALLVGLMPAIRASRSNLQHAVREGSKGAGGGSRGRLRASLVVAEVALALVVLAGTGLAIRSVQALMRIDPGFDATNVISGRVDLPSARYASDDAWISFHVELERRLGLLPGVQTAALTNALPLGGSGSESGILPEGRPLPAPGESMTGSTFYAVSPKYFAALGMRLVDGRAFTERDTAGTPLVAVVDERLARAFWPNERAIGKRVAFETEQGTEKESIRPIWREVVGVVETVRHYGLTVESPRVQIYTPVTQLALWFRQRHPSMALVLRTSQPADGVMADVRREVAALDRDIPVHSIVSVQTLLDSQTASSRLTMSLMLLFGVLALVLAVIGVYGVMAASVSRRTQEFGIRLALGATRFAVFTLVARQAGWLLATGVLLGLAGSLVLGRIVTDVFVGVEPGDPWTFLAASLVLGGVVVLASCVPARRAVRVDPLVALRYE